MSWEVVLSSSNDNPVILLWEARTGTILSSYKDSLCDANAIFPLDNGCFAVAQKNKAFLFVYGWHKDHPILQCGMPEKLSCVVVSSDGLYLIAGSFSGNCYLWMISTGELMQSWAAHYSKVTCARTTSDTSLLLTGGEDGMIHIWSLPSILNPKRNILNGNAVTIEPVHTFSHHSLPVTSLYACNGRVFSTSLDRSIKICDLSTHKLLAQVVLPTYSTCCCVNPTETIMYVGGGDGNIYQIDLVDYENAPSRIFSGHSKPVLAVSINFDGTLVVSGAGDGKAMVWDAFSGQMLKSFDPHKGAVANVLVMLNPLLSQAQRTLCKPMKKYPTARSTLEQMSVIVDFKRNGNRKVNLKRKSAAGDDSTNHVQSEVDRLQKEVTDLRKDNERWQKVNSELYAVVNANQSKKT